MNPKKIWKKLQSNRSSKSTSGVTGQHSSSDSNPRAVTIGGHAVNTTSSVAVAAIPSQFPGQQPHQLSPPIESGPGWKTTAYSGTKMAIEVIRESSDVFVPLKSAAGGLSALFKQYDQFIANKDDVRRLIVRAESLTTSLTGPPQENDIKEIERRRVLEMDLKKVLETLGPMVTQSNVIAFLNNANQAAEATGLVEDIRDAITEYQTSLQQGLNENTVALMESTDMLLLEKLQRSPRAGFLSGNRQKCLRGTRVMVLETIENWVHQNRVRRVYWLNGIAGCGKTTIAQSFAERMFAEGLLGASFFCSRDFPDGRNLHFIFPTLAFQLAYKYPAFRAHLLNAIKSTPDVGYGSLENQLKMLLVDPLRSTGLSTVIIIDALDECEDEEPASAILSLLAREIEHIPLVKFFITGRPEPRIRKGFHLPALRPQTEILLLHEVERGNVDEDIQLFLEYHLGEIVKDRSDIDLTTPWPAQEDVRIVTSKAAGLFIYAFTVIKFLASISHNPRERLRLITSMPDSSVYEGLSGIDPLYTCLLDNGCSHIHGSDSEFFSRLLLVISYVVLLCQPIPLASLARLLNLKSEDILTPLRSLHSILLVPDSDSKPIRVFHKSFPDYLKDHQRCRDSRFFVDPLVHHATLAVHCLELMSTELKENICGLPPYAMNSDIRDLSTRQHDLIGEALGYACRFWAKHVCSMSSTGDEVARILSLLDKFFQYHLLRWLEVLSIANDLRGAVHSLLDVERWLLEVKTPDDGLVDCIRECRRFILYSFDPIEQSATHIYHSALVWPPESSVVQTLYRGPLKTQVKVLNGIDTSWDPCIRSIHLCDAEFVSSVAFSNRGNLIAGCSGPVAKILEAATGVCLATLNGHEKDVICVAFSPDDVFLTSGSKDATVRVWDVQTGAMVTSLEGHVGYVNSVAFSPAGTVIASGADDDTIRIWNFSSGSCDRILEGHSNWVLSVCWTQAMELVSGSADKEIKVWNVSSGECLKTFGGHSDYVWSVASSPDASKIVSGSDDQNVRLFDARTGDVLQTILEKGGVRSVCFTPDGSRIVYATGRSIIVWDLVQERATFKWQSASRFVALPPDGSCIAARTSDGFVKIFNMETGDQGHGIRDQHSGQILCVTLAADGQLIASGSRDETVKVWDATTNACVQTFHGHSRQVYSVAISPDSSLVASGSADRSVRVWSVHTNSATADPCLHIFNGHSDWIRSVTFSPNSSLIASGSDDKTVGIWSLHDPDLIRTLTGHSNWVMGVMFSPDSRRVASVSLNQEIILWDVEKAEKLALLPRQSGRWLDSRVSFSADGTRVMLESGEFVKRWRIRPSADSFSKHSAVAPPDDISSKDASLPITLVSVPDDGHSVPHDDVPLYRYLKDTEWILDRRNRRVCWVPEDRRGFSGVSRDKKVLLWTRSGRTIELDFSDITP